DQPGRRPEDAGGAVGADAVDEHTRVELEGLPQAGVDRLREAQARGAPRRGLGRRALSRQHVPNGPGPASACPPRKMGLMPLAKPSMAPAYSPDQLLARIPGISAKSARLAVAMAAWTSMSTSRSSRSSSPRSIAPTSCLRIVNTGSRAFHCSTSSAER